MIKILEHGSLIFKTTCNKCGCKFTYTKEDLIPYFEPSLESSYHYVRCPEFNDKCRHNESNKVKNINTFCEYYTTELRYDGHLGNYYAGKCSHPHNNNKNMCLCSGCKDRCTQK